MGKLRVYCLKTLKKLSTYPLGNTPSAPSVNGVYSRGDMFSIVSCMVGDGNWFGFESVGVNLSESFVHLAFPHRGLW